MIYVKVTDELIEAYLNGNEEYIYVYNRETKEVFVLEANATMPDEVIVIPYMTTPEAHRLMVQFAEQQETRIANELLEVLNGKKPFRSFKDQIRGQDIENEWYDFENNHAKSKMSAWEAQNVE